MPTESVPPLELAPELLDEDEPDELELLDELEDDEDELLEEELVPPSSSYQSKAYSP